MKKYIVYLFRVYCNWVVYIHIETKEKKIMFSIDKQTLNKLDLGSPNTSTLQVIQKIVLFQKIPAPSIRSLHIRGFFSPSQSLIKKNKDYFIFFSVSGNRNPKSYKPSLPNTPPPLPKAFLFYDLLLFHTIQLPSVKYKGSPCSTAMRSNSAGISCTSPVVAINRPILVLQRSSLRRQPLVRDQRSRCPPHADASHLAAPPAPEPREEQVAPRDSRHAQTFNQPTDRSSRAPRRCDDLE